MSVLNCLTAASEIKSEPLEHSMEEAEEDVNITNDELDSFNSTMEIKLESYVDREEAPEEINEDQDTVEEAGQSKSICPNCKCTFSISQLLDLLEKRMEETESRTNQKDMKHICAFPSCTRLKRQSVPKLSWHR